MQTLSAFARRLAALPLLLAAAAAAQPPTLLYALRNGYEVPEENRLDTVDAATAEILESVQITAPGYVVLTSNGMARRPSDGALFVILRAENAADGIHPNLLATLNPATGAASVIGDLGDQFAGLAFLPSGKLYGVTGNGGNVFETLFEINPATAQPTELFSLGHGDSGETIAPAPNGRLLHASGGHSRGQALEFVNPDSGAGIIDLLLSHTFGFSDEPNALAFSAQTGQMYIVNGSSEIYTISLANGDVTFVCAALPSRIKGMAFDGATAYVMDNPNDDDAPSLYTLDLSTGAPLTTVLVSAPGYTLRGATGLARQPGTGALFAVLRTSTNVRVLAVINPVTGAADVRGALPDRFSNISFRANGALYGVTGDGAAEPSALYTINTSTAAATLVRHLGHGNDGEAIGFAGDALYHASGRRDGNEYFERVDLSVVVPPRYEQVISPNSHAFPFGEALALAWSDSLGKMFMTERSNGLYTIGTAAPALVTPVGVTGRYLKGLAFDGPTLYAVANEGPFDLITLNPLTGATLSSVNVSLPGFSTSHLTGLRSPTNGKLYAILDIGTGVRHLATINPATGLAADIGDLGDKFAGLAFRANGTLIGVTGNGAAIPEALWVINPATAASTFLLQLGNGADGEAIAVAADGFLYHASGIDPGDQYWERINLDSLQVTDIPLPGASYPWDEPGALATRPGSPVALVADTDGALFSINTSTGQGQFIGVFHTGKDNGRGNGIVMKGLLYAQAPCPGDTNGDGVVDFIDLNIVLSAFGTSTGNPNFIPGADLDGDGDVDFIDLNIILSFFGTGC